MTLHNPFESDHGERARATMLRLLAATGGAAGDFAEEVLAGRRQPHELLAHGPVLDEFVQEARGWRQVIDALPAEQRRRLAADAWTTLEQQVGELAALDVDAAVTELRELAARTPETEPPQDRDSLADDADWFNRSPWGRSEPPGEPAWFVVVPPAFGNTGQGCRIGCCTTPPPLARHWPDACGHSSRPGRR